MNHFINISTALALALTLSACGGGGGKSNNTPANTSNGGSSTGNTNGGGNSSTGNGSNGGGSTSNQTNSSTGNGSNNTNGSTGNQTNTTNPDNNKSSSYVCTGGGEMMYGHQLPPCPDPVENAKTLLGIDTNNNGVRDDVEIWIYHTYDTYIPCVEENVTVTLSNENVVHGFKDVCEDKRVPYHQIVREVAMQYAKGAQVIIQEPEKARETRKYFKNAQYCEWYFKYDAKYNNETLVVPDKVDFYDELDNIQFNTIARAKAYSEYNFYLGGGIYPSPNTSEERAACDFDIDKLLGK
jgi:hypothetical protein